MIFIDVLLFAKALPHADNPGRSFSLDFVFSSGALLSASLLGGFISKSIESI